MLRNLKLRPTRSVAFAMQSYAVEVVRSRPLRHRIYGAENIGFRATATGLSAAAPSITGAAAAPLQDVIEFKNRRFQIGGEFLVDFTEPFSDKPSCAFRVDERLGRLLGFDILGSQLLLIQQFGLAVVDVTFDASEFNMRTLAHVHERIIDGTCRVLGESVVFLTAGGMCRVGRNGRLQLLDIPLPNQYGQAWVEESRYHLDVGDRVLVIENFFDSWFFLGGSRHWVSDHFMVGYAANRQFIKQVRLETSADLTLTVLSESREQRIQIRGKEGVQTINVNLKGESFRLRIETDSDDIRITGLTAVVGFTN